MLYHTFLSNLLHRLKVILIPFVLFILLLAFSVQPNLSSLNSNLIQAKKGQEELKHEVVVVLKLVQVHISDKKGNSVTDLEKSDFILYDNGKLQTVTDFERHILAKPEQEVEVSELAPPKKAPSRMNRKFLLLLDIQRNDAIGMIKSKKAALHFIDTQISQDDEIGVLAYSPITGIDLHLYLTTDHQKVREVIKRLKEILGKPGVEGILPPERKSQRAEDRSDSVAVSKGESEGSLSHERRHSETEIRTESMATMIFFRRLIKDPGWKHVVRSPVDSIKQIKELATALRHIPGNKNIIFFSGGFARSLFRNQGFRMIFEDMSKELASSNSPVYSVNSMGTRDHFRGSQAIGYNSLKVLSELSGGKYFEDIDHYETIAEEIQNVTSNYYVLGYYIDEKWDGKYHEIKVKVKRKECLVHAQGGFFNPKPFTEFSEFEKQLHLIDLALSNKPHFQEHLIFPSIALLCSNKYESNIVLFSEIQKQKMKEIIRQKTEVITLVFGKDNSLVESEKAEIGFSTIPEKTIYHYTISSLPPGEYECRIVIRNLKTGKGAVASSSVDIPEPLDSGIRLYPPLLLVSGKGASYLRASKAQKKETEGKPLSLINIYPFLSNKYSPLVGEPEHGISRILAVVRCLIIDIQEPDVKLSVDLMQHSSGEKIPLSSSILSAKNEENIVILLIELGLPELQSGLYSLNFNAEELTTQAKSQVSRTFRVR